MEDEYLDDYWESQYEIEESGYDYEPDEVDNYSEYESPSTGLFGGDMDFYPDSDY